MPVTDEIRNVIRPLHLLIGNSAGAPYDQYSVTRAAAGAILAQLSYCTIDQEERATFFQRLLRPFWKKLLQPRAVLVPSLLYEAIAQSGETISLAAVLPPFDLEEPIVVRTENFVAMALFVRDELFIGVRGTHNAYDIFADFCLFPQRFADRHRSIWYHDGFGYEAVELISQLQNELMQRYRKRCPAGIVVAGHSLGGAIAAIMHYHNQPNLGHWGQVARAAYIFGSPRASWMSPPVTTALFAVKREQDIIPHAPPMSLGYKDYSKQFHTDGSIYRVADRRSRCELVRSVLWRPYRKIKDFHSMERYRNETLVAAFTQTHALRAHWDKSFLFPVP
jgi:hypothetical protein